MKFDELGLGPEVLKATAAEGYDKPTQIQQHAIPIVLQGRDLLGCAQTGTGKTAAFVLPMIDILKEGRARARMPRALLLSPTRELAQQTLAHVTAFSGGVDLATVLLIGGSDTKRQELQLAGRVDILIATPGRLLDMVDRCGLLMVGVKYLVIDEADRMLDMGFIPDVTRICSLLPPLRQTLMFSATMPPEIRNLADNFLQNPREIAVDPPSTPASTVEQELVVVKNDDDKFEHLRRRLQAEPDKSVMVFANRKKDVERLYLSLRNDHLPAVQMQGDMTQQQREAALDSFKSGESRILVCTDVVGRGIDIFGVNVVYCYDVPVNPEDYVHRIGRTGRAGQAGHSVLFATRKESKWVGDIEKLTGCVIPPSADQQADAESPKKTSAKRSRRRKRPDDVQENNGIPASPIVHETDHDEAEDVPFGEDPCVPAFLLRPVSKQTVARVR